MNLVSESRTDDIEKPSSKINGAGTSPLSGKDRIQIIVCYVAVILIGTGVVSFTVSYAVVTSYMTSYENFAFIFYHFYTFGLVMFFAGMGSKYLLDLGYKYIIMAFSSNKD